MNLRGSRIAERVSGSRPLFVAIILIGVVLALISAVRFQAPELLGQHKVLTDFDAFYIAGHLAAEGQTANAYHMSTMLAAQKEMTGTHSFMPWTYPPPFTLLMEGFAALPIGFAFLLFVLSSFAFYLWVLRSIAGRWLPGVVLAIAPVVILNLRTGQNGFLIAGMIGACLIALRENRRVAGVPLGLLVMKPHLGVGLGFLVLLSRRWSVLTIACFLALALLVISTVAYGIGIWTDFGSAIAEASGFLAAKYYPMFRMNSIYACARSLGFPASVALIFQIVSALTALAALGYAYICGISYNRLAALTCAASLCISPYGYDYDLAILGIGLAFIMPEIMQRSTNSQYIFLNIACWLACGYGIGWNTAASFMTSNDTVALDAEGAGVSLIFFIFSIIIWQIYQILSGENSDKLKMTSDTITEKYRRT